MMTFACPSCAKLFKVNAEMFGTAVQCPGCGRGCRIKAKPAPVPAAPLAQDETAHLSGASHESPPADATAAYGSSGDVFNAETASQSAMPGQETRSLGEKSDTGSITLGQGDEAVVRLSANLTQLPRKIGRFLIRRCLGEGA